MASTRKATSKRSVATKSKKTASSKRPTIKGKKTNKVTPKSSSAKKKKISQQAESKNVKFLPKLPTSVTLRSRLSLLALTPYRFPLDIDRLAIQSARVAGVSFVLAGAIFTISHFKPFVDQLVLGIVPFEQTSATYESTKQRPEEHTVSSALPDLTTDFVIGSTSENNNELIDLVAPSNTTQVVLWANNLKSGKSSVLGKMKILFRDEEMSKWSYIWKIHELKPGQYWLIAEITEKTDTDSPNTYVLVDSKTYFVNNTDSDKDGE